MAVIGTPFLMLLFTNSLRFLVAKNVATTALICTFLMLLVPMSLALFTNSVAMTTTVICIFLMVVLQKPGFVY